MCLSIHDGCGSGSGWPKLRRRSELERAFLVSSGLGRDKLAAHDNILAVDDVVDGRVD
jgi:hypothetical protein